MLIINSVEYASYLDICKAYNIDYKSFVEYKLNNSNISELELLGHFISNIAVNMSNGNYFIRDKH